MDLGWVVGFGLLFIGFFRRFAIVDYCWYKQMMSRIRPARRPSSFGFFGIFIEFLE